MCEQTTVSTAYIDEAANQLREGLSKIQHCVSQLDEQQMWWRPHEAQNSIANLMLHFGGNLRQCVRAVAAAVLAPGDATRWTAFAVLSPLSRLWGLRPGNRA